jgi:hypothetical protein
MNDRLYIKSLIVVILVILIGACCLPSISGYNISSSIQVTNENPNNLFLSDDFVDAYWMFDECDGDILYDSSLHSYDGTIYGATWESHGSGCALSFDGVDDYVDFDDYAYLDLGFNKSDDAIFSFKFKSTSTERGIIYSISRGDQYGYNPGFHIALAANGSIELKVWRVNCGIWMYTSENFNDGSWHFAEIFYNGETANPTADIYIDGELEKTQKRWVCYFYDDQFKHADMGRNSYDFTNYYEGELDDFKIINYPGGNEQLPPIIGGPLSGIPGVEYDYTFEVVDIEGDDCEIKVNFHGDETDWLGPFEPGDVVTIGYTWDEIGNYSITSRSRDRWGTGPWSTPFNVIIGNYPPDAPTIDGPIIGDPGKEHDYIFNADDPDGDDVKYYIDWGDDTSEVTEFNPSGTDVTVSHTWASSGKYSIIAYAEDTYGLTSPTSTYQVVMPKDKIKTNFLFFKFLELFPRTFQLVHQLVNL